jgi:hypothetical protein
MGLYRDLKDQEVLDRLNPAALPRLPVKQLPALELAPFPRDKFLAWCQGLRIQTKDFGLRQFELLGTQVYVLDEICKGLEQGISSFVILKARQLGMSTFFIALDLFWAFEHKGLSGAFATHTDQSKALFRNIVRTFFANLPKTHKVKSTTENRDMLILKNGSMFAYLVAGIKQKEVGSLGRSGAFNFLHASEVAFWGTEEDKKELMATMSTHYKHRLQIFESTANGFNHFEEQWAAAKNSPTQRAIFVGWWRNELYSFPQSHPWYRIYMPDGDATMLSVLERRRVRAVKEIYDVQLTAEQLAWYRWKLREEIDGDQAKMDEQFPWTEDDAFVATGSKFFTNDSLTLAMRHARRRPLLAYRYLIGDQWDKTGVVAAQQKQATLKIWEEPVPNGIYSIGCDPAYGSSDDADRSVVHVARCYADRVIQVAEFCTTEVSTYQCAWVLAHLAGYYRNVSVNLEISGPGTTVFDELERLRRDIGQGVITVDADKNPIANVLGAMKYYMYKKPDNPAGGLVYQWRTSSSEIKAVLMNGFRDAFELNRHSISSLYCLEEMKGVILEGGVIHGEGRKKDDRVIAAALAHEMWRRWIQPRLHAGGLTYASVMANDVKGPPSKAESIAIDYLRRARILAPGQNIGAT